MEGIVSRYWQNRAGDEDRVGTSASFGARPRSGASSAILPRTWVSGSCPLGKSLPRRTVAAPPGSRIRRRCGCSARAGYHRAWETDDGKWLSPGGVTGPAGSNLWHFSAHPAYTTEGTGRARSSNGRTPDEAGAGSRGACAPGDDRGWFGSAWGWLGSDLDSDWGSGSGLRFCASRHNRGKAHRRGRRKRLAAHRSRIDNPSTSVFPGTAAHYNFRCPAAGEMRRGRGKKWGRRNRSEQVNGRQLCRDSTIALRVTQKPQARLDAARACARSGASRKNAEEKAHAAATHDAHEHEES